MKQKIMLSAIAAACASFGVAQAQESTLDKVVVSVKRENRASKGATGLSLDIKDTPQTISTVDKDDMKDFGTTDSNEALRLGTGINVEQYETNRAVFNARGFEVQLTQIDGLGMTNDYGTVAGQQDTYLFERIELIRGANGLLTGVGNSSGTINYVRKRPTNKDQGEISLGTGSYNKARAALDYNKVFTEDGAWAGRLIVVNENKDSYLRSLNDKHTSVYGVVDGQLGDNGVLTFGFSYQDAKQKAPMWGSLTLNYADGRPAEFDVGTSTSQDWAFWNILSKSAFVEYTHKLNPNWEAKITYNVRNSDEAARLFYAFPFTAGLNNDNTGLYGWPYNGFVWTDSTLLDANISGQFDALGRKHSLVAGFSRSHQNTTTGESAYDTAKYQFLPLPAVPYGGNTYPEPEWGPLAPTSGGEQTLTRFYAATRLTVTDELKAILGMNAVKLERAGNSRYGALVTNTVYPNTEKVSPYVGFTYDFSKRVLGYVSYSDIFQNQDQVDINNKYLDPMTGVNTELGVKADWLDKKFLTTFALFSSEQRGIATAAGQKPDGTYYSTPKDVRSQGFELEATGRLDKDSKLTLGLTSLKATGPDGNDTYEWIPRTVVNFRYDTRFSAVPKLRAGIGGRWQSETSKNGGYKQGAYFTASAFANYELTQKATVRVNVNNLFDQKYVGGLSYGAIYGAPRSVGITLDYKL